MSEIDAFWAAAHELKRAMRAESERKKLARAEKRRVTARARYAQRKAAGTLVCKPEPPPVEHYEPVQSCQCAAVRMPPCSWCENGGDDAA